jgi:peptidoglycan hydrolase-like protein with peptidoglycan-binding domain
VYGVSWCTSELHLDKMFRKVGERMSEIAQAVGRSALNLRQDVATVQTLLNDNQRKLGNLKPLKVDGIAGPKTLAAIELFQKQVVKLAVPDSKVDPGGLTWKALLRVGCDPPAENFPYDANTFQLISQLAFSIKMYSQKFNVPPVAVAGSIADEYNTRRGIRVPLEWIQDNFWVNFATNAEFERRKVGKLPKAIQPDKA